jgi:GH15 family glucan-1,4-alpha-glucosidase
MNASKLLALPQAKDPYDEIDARYTIRGEPGAWWIAYKRDQNAPMVRVTIVGEHVWADRERAAHARSACVWRAFRTGVV